MATRKLTFTFTTPKGEVETLSPELSAIAARILPLAVASTKSLTEVEKKNRAIAEILVDERQNHSYTPRKTNPATSKGHVLALAVLAEAGVNSDSFNDKGKYVLPACDIDWNGSSPTAAAAERQIWEAVTNHLNIQGWVIATGLTFSDYPLVKNVAFHIDRVVKERIGNATDYVVLTGKVFEEPGKARTNALAALKNEDGESNPGGETDVSAASSATTAKQNVEATLVSIKDSLAGISVKGLRGNARLAIHNHLNEINLTVQVLLSETKPAAPADKRRVRAADAS